MMNFGLTAHDRFCLARLEGLVTLDAWVEVLARLETALAASSAPPRLIVDMTAVVGYLGIPERRAVGALMSRHFAAMEKVALVVQAHKITDVVFNEARRNGLDLRLFPVYEDAMSWATSRDA
jgi:hypothetical protein